MWIGREAGLKEEAALDACQAGCEQVGGNGRQRNQCGNQFEEGMREDRVEGLFRGP
jgi:hypothetical protein